jgi:uncharacterized protein
MREPRNVDLVRGFYESLHDENVERFMQMLSREIEWAYPEADGIPYGGVRRGHEGVLEFFDLHDQADEILELSPEEYIAQGDRVVVLGTYAGRARPTHREWRTQFVHVYDVADGRIQRFRVFFDTAAFLEAHRRHCRD